MQYILNPDYNPWDRVVLATHWLPLREWLLVSWHAKEMLA